jgi:hypothetical protein
MLQKHSVPHLPPPHPASLLETPSPTFVKLPETLDDFTDNLDNFEDSEASSWGGWICSV